MSVIYHGQCLAVMSKMQAESVTSIVTDPPYALEFMDQGWDSVLPKVEVWQEALRVMKSGGMALVFGGTRTFHRLTCSLEDAGFQIRDVLCWLYGSGFPKSLDISKAIDRQRFDRDEVLEVTRWIASTRDAARVSNERIDRAFGLCGMAGHWTSSKSQPAVPTLDQVPKLLEVLGNPEVPEHIGLMVKMPENTIVLDPFMGSGSTGVACELEGVQFVGIERKAGYSKIAAARI